METVTDVSQVEGRPPSPQAPQQRPRGYSILRMVVEAGKLSKEQAKTAQETALREQLPLWRVLVRDGLVGAQELSTLTALYFGLTSADLRSQTIDPRALAYLPEELARKYVALPLQVANGSLTVAVVDPTDLHVIQDLAARTGLTINPIVATPEDIETHIDISYRLTENLSAEGSVGTTLTGGRVNASVIRDAPPAQVMDLLLQQAIQDRASDIHLEPAEARLRVRFRIDGILHEVIHLPISAHPAIISRLKIMSGLNIAERRRPQDGNFNFEFQNRRVDVRVAVASTVAGEMAVLRLLDKQFTIMGLEQLGMSQQSLEKFRRLLRIPYGMVVICGPTGSGKSTSLYASLLQMNRAERNIISVEDPVEYRIADANQMQVHAEAGITFATYLRSILRLDPDVLLVGEIRDQETATIAIQAALTGHLVLTSLHANDSVAALVRLRDLGVAPYLLAASVAGVVSQRMVRVVCNSCPAMIPRPLAEQKAYAAVMGETQEQFIYGAGCNLCAHTGYRGRSGVFETLLMSDALRGLFLADGSRDQMRDQALKEGMVPLGSEGMLKVKEGVTTPYEVMRVLFSLD